jgi:hypothetical protein
MRTIGINWGPLPTCQILAITRRRAIACGQPGGITPINVAPRYSLKVIPIAPRIDRGGKP